MAKKVKKPQDKPAPRAPMHDFQKKYGKKNPWLVAPDQQFYFETGNSGRGRIAPKTEIMDDGSVHHMQEADAYSKYGIYDNSDLINDYLKSISSADTLKPKVAPRLENGGMLKDSTMKLSSKMGMEDADMGDAMALNSAVLGGAANIIGDIGGGIADARIKSLEENATVADNPGEVMKKVQRTETAGNMVESAGKYASAGAALGPLGMVGGAAIGMLLEGGKAILNKKSNDTAALKATQGWSSGNAKTAMQYAKDGGMIEGKGGPKSDSIKMDAPKGSFVVPAENSEEGMRLGRKFLGWNDHSVASRKNGGTDIMVSDGEVFFTPEEVGALSYYGVDMNKLAPNAKPQHKMSKHATGMKEDPIDTSLMKKVQSIDNQSMNDRTAGEVVSPESKLKSLSNLGINTDLGGLSSLSTKQTTPDPTGEAPSIGLQSDGTNTEDVNNDGDKPDWMKYVPEALGFAQILGGAAGLISAGKKPDLNVSATLQKLSGEVRRKAQYGLDPKVKNALLNDIERTRRDYDNSISEKGGSAMDVMNSRLKGLMATMGQKAKIAYTDSQEKTRKWADVMKTDTMKAGQEFDISKINLADYYRTQEMWADVLSAGVHNTVGARQLKSEQDMMREMADKYGFKFS